MTATKTQNGIIKIMIADDHPIFRQGLKHTFSETTDIDVVGEPEKSSHPPFGDSGTGAQRLPGRSIRRSFH
jgi:hypothetical protein